MKRLILVRPILLLVSGEIYSQTVSAAGLYEDLGNGVIRDSETGLLWSQQDSFVDLGISVNWNKAGDYRGAHPWGISRLADPNPCRAENDL
jgi:hypothetical protein